jgi:pheophorbide a oxygenase
MLQVVALRAPVSALVDTSRCRAHPPQALPQWLNHVVFRHAVLDGDSVFLHRQEHLLRERAQAGLSWKQSVYLPTRADTLVAAVRSFVEGPGGGGPHGPLHQARGYPPLISDRRALLNRYDQHTKSCVKCARALMSVQRARAAAGAGAAAAWAASLVLALQWAQARAAAAATAALPQVAVAAAAGAVLLTLAWRALALLEQRFFFVDYVHATR